MARTNRCRIFNVRPSCFLVAPSAKRLVSYGADDLDDDDDKDALDSSDFLPDVSRPIAVRPEGHMATRTADAAVHRSASLSSTAVRKPWPAGQIWRIFEWPAAHFPAWPCQRK